MSDNGGNGRGVDLVSEGVREEDLPDGAMVAGRIGDEAVLLVRRGSQVFAMGATCTHYGGPLADGLFDGEGIRCPWHHACFDVRTGVAAQPPALRPVKTYEVVARGGRLYAGASVDRRGAPPPPPYSPGSVLIVGGGAAGNKAAVTLREEGYSGPITMISADDALPYDRPNLSKDYLAGNAPEDWLPLRSAEFYAERDIEVLLGRRVTALDAGECAVTLDDGRRMQAGAVLLATGADPVRLSLPGGDLPHVHYLRSLADSRAIIAAAGEAKRAVVVGASFIGLEVAASLVARGLDVHVVAPEAVPMARVLGPELGAFVGSLHEARGVHFHLEETVVAISEASVTLKDGSSLAADLVVLGVGVRPAIQLAERAGLELDRGVVVNEYLETSAPGVWAAGDIARWPDRHSGRSIRVEHWVVAERQGQTAARNMLGKRETFDAVPFFWSQHYDVQINYVGHAEEWDHVEVAGDIEGKDCTVGYLKDGKVLAIASIFRDIASLRAELAMERGDQAGLHALLSSA